MQVSVDKLGYENLRPGQETVVREFFVSGKDTFVALPTGYEKSLMHMIIRIHPSLPL